MSTLQIAFTAKQLPAGTNPAALIVTFTETTSNAITTLTLTPTQQSDTFTLPPGTYSATVQLKDASGAMIDSPVPGVDASGNPTFTIAATVPPTPPATITVQVPSGLLITP